MTPPAETGLPVQAADKVTAADAEFAGKSRPRHAKPGRGQPGIWLHAAAAGLFMLAGAAAAVSFAAQYRLVYAARHLAVAAALEAAIPDAAALVFACLGVALAVHGRRAFRARLLNVASAGASVFMNVIAAAPGWRDLAVWAMPPAAYALASDTLISVVRTGALARRHDPAPGGDLSPLASAAGVALWLLRLAMAPASTLAGFRAWVIAECPVAPGHRAASQAGAGSVPAAAPADLPALPAPRAAVSLVPQVPAVPPGIPAATVPGPAGSRPSGSSRRDGTKTARFLALVIEEHGPLAAIPLQSVARISAVIAPRADLNSGAARAALRRAMLGAQKGQQR